MKEKLSNIIKKLNQGLIERKNIIKISLLTLLAQENLVLVGPPGTAKSEISRRLSHIIKDGSYFEYLLTKFTTPEELFGPLSISELKKDNFIRKTNGYLPKSDVVFLDEIFKANSSILNSLLTMINEKVYHNGRKTEKAPLKTVIGASNELPLGESELRALYDRFLMRLKVNYISDDSIEEIFKINKQDFSLSDDLKLSDDEIYYIKSKSKHIEIPEKIIQLIKDIREDYKEAFNENRDEILSDRKLIKIIDLLKVSAVTNERKKVNISDLLLLKYCLWNNPDNLNKINSIIIQNLKKYSHQSKANKQLIEDQKKENSSSTKLKGKGTKDNPFLIENASDLFSLNNNELNEHNYYFKQTQDIDLNEFVPWESLPKIKGEYDGGYNKILNLSSTLFRTITENSVIKNLYVKDIDLNFINDDAAINFGGIADLNIGLIKNCIVTGKISAETGHTARIAGIANSNYKNGKIISCCTDLNINIKNINPSVGYTEIGGITNDKGIVENCYTLGEYVYPRGKVSGITTDLGNVISNSYSKCLIKAKSGGGLSYRTDVKNSIALNKKIEFKKDGYRISEGNNDNNYALNTVKVNEKKVYSSKTGKHGKDVPETVLSQSFFENTLNWDFEEVWEWNEKEKRPILQFEKYFDEDQEKMISGKNKVSNLDNQIKNNIWL